MATVGSRVVDRVVGKLIEWCYVRGTDIVLVVVGVLFIGIGLGLWSCLLYTSPSPRDS